eukprot:365873-Chlamydomonas_euryale.AAC.2
MPSAVCMEPVLCMPSAVCMPSVVCASPLVRVASCVSVQSHGWAHCTLAGRTARWLGALHVGWAHCTLAGRTARWQRGGRPASKQHRWAQPPGHPTRPPLKYSRVRCNASKRNGAVQCAVRRIVVAPTSHNRAECKPGIVPTAGRGPPASTENAAGGFWGRLSALPVSTVSQHAVRLFPIRLALHLRVIHHTSHVTRHAARPSAMRVCSCRSM